MYRIQNVSPGVLCLDMERGSISLQNGQSYDIEIMCSRAWLDSNETLKRLVAQQHIRVLHDSSVVVIAPKISCPPVPKPLVVHVLTQPDQPQVPSVKASISVAKPVIIDLSGKPDPTVDAHTPVVPTHKKDIVSENTKQSATRVEAEPAAPVVKKKKLFGKHKDVEK